MKYQNLPIGVSKTFIFPYFYGLSLEKCVSKYPITKLIQLHPKFDINESFRIASRKGYFDILKYLISLEPNIDVRADDDVAFRWASFGFANCYLKGGKSCNF